ncbi:MAG: endonuclease domain-containing protein [Actinomycetota bacterium]|nr:endonuclease domain-containing protein [Actinomycetota bacterium]
MNLDSWVQTHGPLVSRRDHRAATSTVDSAVRSGLLTAVLPGVYLLASVAHDLRWRIAAVLAWRPDAVVCGAAAAWLTFWPELRVGTIDVAVRAKSPKAGFRFHRGAIPPELIGTHRHGLRITAPALTTLDLVSQFGADVIDRALRSRQVTLEQLWNALAATRCRAGNFERRRHLLDSRDAPWSAAERLAHRLLRGAGISGWRSNFHLFYDGRDYYVDIAFPGLRLAVEIDGRLHETDPRIFEKDRYRQNALVAQGWTVLRFTYRMLVDDPEYVVRTIRRALAAGAA